MLENLDYIPTPWGNAAKYGGGGGNVPLDSPAFTGIPTAPTAAPGTNTTQLATTEFVSSEISNDRPYGISNPLINGTASAGTSNSVSREDHVHPSDTSRLAASDYTAADILSKLLTVDGTDSLLDTDLVRGTTPGAAGLTLLSLTALSSITPYMNGTGTVGISDIPSREDHIHPKDSTKADLVDGMVPLSQLPTGTSLTLGETGTTAYRGDRGKAAYDHISLTTAHEATSTNTASRIVLRDGNGSFSAGNITTTGLSSTGDISASSFLSLKGATSGDPTTSVPILRFYNSGESQYVQFRYSDHDSVHGVGGGIWLQGYDSTPAWLDVAGAVYATIFYGDLSGNASSVSWSGITSKPNITLSTYANGYWGLSLPDGTSAGYIRTTTSGIIPYASGGSGTLGTSSWPFSTIYGTNIYGTLNGSVTGGTCAPSYLTIPSTASTTNGRMWIA